MTTVLGLGTLAFADFGKFRNSGPTIAVCLLVALAACVTLAPAILRMAGRSVFWPFALGKLRRDAVPLEPSQGNVLQSDAEDSGVMHGLWDWLSRRIIARPGLILTGSLLLLAPLAWHARSVVVTYDLLSGLQPSRPSVRGTRLLRDYFPAGETGPVTVLAYREEGGFDASLEQREKIERLAKGLYGLTYRDSHGDVTQPITTVRSLAEPLGERPEKYGFFEALRRGVVRGHHVTKSTYLASAPEYLGKVTRLDLVTRYDPFSLESVYLLDAIDSHLYKLSQDPDSEWYGTQFYFLGTTAGIHDLRTVIDSDTALIQKLVPLAVLAVLLVVLRSPPIRLTRWLQNRGLPATLMAVLRRPLVSVYLILSVMFGYYVSLGCADLFFSWLYGDSYVGLDWMVPVFLFVILVAVGEDYNIYLATRVFEEQARRGGVEGLRVALVRTGGIITSCGVIMAGTFASMISGSLRSVIMLGVAHLVRSALGHVCDPHGSRSRIPGVVGPLHRPAAAPIDKEETQAERTEPAANSAHLHGPFGRDESPAGSVART